MAKARRVRLEAPEEVAAERDQLVAELADVEARWEREVRRVEEQRDALGEHLLAIDEAVGDVGRLLILTPRQAGVKARLTKVYEAVRLGSLAARNAR